MESFSVDTDYRLEDLRALEAAARVRLTRNSGTPWRLATRLSPLAFVIMFVGGIALLHGPDAQLAWALGELSVLLFFVLLVWLARRNRRPSPNGALLGASHYEFGVDGMRVVRRFSEGTFRWAQVQGIETTLTHLFLWTDTATGYAVPLRDLPPPMTGDIAVERLRGFIAAAPRDADADIRAGISTVPVEYSALPAPAAATPVSPWRELLAVARALGLQRFDSSQIAGRDSSIFLLGGILLALWIPLDPLVYADPLEFDWYSVPGLAWTIAGAFALAWLLTRLMRPPAGYRRVLLLTLGALPIAMLGSVAFGRLPDGWFFPLVAIFAAYGALYFRNSLRSLSGANQYRAMVIGAFATYLFILAGNFLEVNSSPWILAQESEDDSGSDDDAVWARMAALQFGQQARIDADVARIAEHATAQPDVFFLGFAGNGKQRVFAQEITLAAKVVGARYHANERELLLVNDARDPERRPLATPEALRHSLLALGRIMGPDDVLFLALSSHGGEDGSIEVANEGMVPMSLSAEELAAMLRDAKIPRKVIVISACYAGAFVPVLADEHTTVITAAAADRTSFGCADDRDLTYFGEAFYRDALPGARTLQDAFETARHDLAEREREERIEPSLPQASFAPDELLR